MNLNLASENSIFTRPFWRVLGGSFFSDRSRLGTCKRILIFARSLRREFEECCFRIVLDFEACSFAEGVCCDGKFAYLNSRLPFDRAQPKGLCSIFVPALQRASLLSLFL